MAKKKTARGGGTSAAKSSPAKKAPAKKKPAKGKGKATDRDPVTGEKLLFDSAIEVPKEVAEAAGDYEKKLTAAIKAVGKAKAARENATELMRKHGVERVAIRNGAEWLVLTETDSVKIQKSQTDDDGKPIPF